MATPMSAFFSAGASFTPSPVIATTFRWPGTPGRGGSCAPGETRANTATSAAARRSSASDMRLDILPHDEASSVAMPTCCSDVLRGERVIAGDHDRADARCLAQAHGLARLPDAADRSSRPGRPASGPARGRGTRLGSGSRSRGRMPTPRMRIPRPARLVVGGHDPRFASRHRAAPSGRRSRPP